MSATISTAHVSGPLGQALALLEGETWLFETSGGRRRPTSNDIRFFFDYGMEVRPVSLGGPNCGSSIKLSSAMDVLPKP